MTFRMPDWYYEQPEPDPASVMEEAHQDADSLVSEWASEGELEVWIDVSVNERSHEPLFDLRRVAHDGQALYTPSPAFGPGEQFDTIEDLRTWMVQHFPLLAQQ